MLLTEISAAAKMDQLQSNMRSRDMHVVQSERWCDPRAKLLSGAAWEQHKIPVCRSLNLCTDFDEAFGHLSAKLENTYVVGKKHLNHNAIVW